MRGILRILLPLGLLLIVGAATPVLAADSWTIGTPAPTFPTALVWETGPSLPLTNPKVVANNNGDSWDNTCKLWEVGVVTTNALQRWTLAGGVPVTGTVANGGSFTFTLPIVAPPLTTLKYNAPVAPALVKPTDVAVKDTLPCNWNMARVSTFMSGSAEVPAPIAVSRFSDMTIPSEAAYFPYVEELAGAVPVIAQGYQDGTYKPSVSVTRDQMAVYLQRALQLPLLPAAGTFSDVLPSYWAVQQIEAVARAGIALGYPGGGFLPQPYYAPTNVVSRDQMAVFVARGMVGGDSKVPAGPATATFSDVPTNYWAFKYVQFLSAQNVVSGFPDGTYHPADPVTRDQMAKFVYNAFVMLTAPVVLGGPAITQVNPSTATYFGWPSSAAARGSNTGYAYCVFDALRLQPSLLTKGSGKWNISFALWGPAQPPSLLNPLVLITATAVAVDSGTITTAKTAAQTSGVPYYVVAVQLPVLATTNPAGTYQLQVTVGDANGTGRLLPWQPTYNIP